jgi:hypothetical protein
MLHELDTILEVPGQEDPKPKREKPRYRRCSVKGRETHASQFWLDLPYVIWIYADNRIFRMICRDINAVTQSSWSTLNHWTTESCLGRSACRCTRDHPEKSL